MTTEIKEERWTEHHCDMKLKVYDVQMQEIMRRMTENEKDLKNNLEKIYNRIEETLKEALRRPSWITLTIITILSSAVVGLLVKR